MTEIKNLSVLWGVFGAFQMMVGLCTGVLFGMFGFVPMLSGDEEGMILGGVFMGFAVLFVLMFCLFSIPGLVVAWGLSKQYKWAGIVAGLMSLFLLLNFPIGTMIGGYTLYVLFKPENQAVLR